VYKSENVPEQEAEKIVGTVIQLLKKKRESLGLSQRSLAAQAGVDPKTVSLIERGIRSPTLFTLALLASALSFPLWRVLKEAESDTPNA
jgi:transcriptional regulator with XRE-family HTH domain